MTITQIIGLVVLLLLAVLGIVLILKKSEKHNLAKWILLFAFIGISLTWIFGYGNYNGATFTDYGMTQQGLTDIPNFLYYAMNFAGDKVVFLLVLGCFYGVLSKVKGYNKLVKRIAEKFEGKEIVFALVSSLFITLMASLFTQSFIALVFVPFVISILLSMKLDKLTAFSVTFGSVLIGLLGITYGGEGAYWFNYYNGTTVSTGLLYRVLVLVVAYILFNFFTILHMKKVLKDKKLNEKASDPFAVEKVEKDAKCWPIVVVFAIIFVIMILGFVDWGTFGIECFKNFHKSLIEFKLSDLPLIGEWLGKYSIGEFTLFGKILGTLATTENNGVIPGAFGVWNLFHASTFLLVMIALIALIGRVKFDEFLDGFVEGVKKIAKPLALFIGSYIVMLPVYQSTVIPTITNVIFKNISSFNPYLVSLNALFANIFHADFGFTGFTIGTFFTTTYAANVEVIHTIFTTLYGFAALCIPTSGILLIGLSYLDIDYKQWIKYIWIFIVAILVILLILFTIMTYI